MKKFCVECKWHGGQSASKRQTNWCHHPEALDVVTGNATRCEENRVYPKLFCGLEGLWWEPRQK